MNRDKGYRYYFRANATAFGGQLLRPAPEIIEAQAAVSLAPSGGYGSARSERFRHREIVSFDAAYSQVSGSLSSDEKHFNTLITSTVENLNIAGMITADRIISRLSADHPNQDNAVPRITLLGSHFVNLRIAGYEVDLPSNAERLDKCGTYHELLKDQQALQDVAQLSVKKNRPVEQKGVIHGSLFHSVRCRGSELKPEGHTIYVPQFGTIYLGEVIISPMSRRLIMLRVELGCPCEGDLSSNISEGDGHRFP